jgi:hypothetical protein
MGESEFTQWPANNAHRCVCRTEFLAPALFVAVKEKKKKKKIIFFCLNKEKFLFLFQHTDSCAAWRVHAAAEALESRWRVQHHITTTGQQPDWTFLSPLPADLVLPLPQAAAPPIASTALNGTSAHAFFDADGIGNGAGGAGGVGAPVAPADLQAELRDAIVVAASTVEATLRAPVACQALHSRRVLPSPDDIDPSGVTMELAAAAAVAVRRDARRGETRREQLADAAREAARYNAELLHQRQRRGPFDIDPHTNTIQVLPSWFVDVAPSVAQHHAHLQRDLRNMQHIAVDAALQQHRQAESDVRRLVLDHRHATRTGAPPPQRAIDVPFGAADVDMRNPALHDFDPLAAIEPPQRCVGAYFHFAADQRPLLAADQPYLTHQEQARAISSAWRQATPDQREFYEAKARADKERYEAAMLPWAVKSARAQRVQNAIELTARRTVDFTLGFQPPTERDESVLTNPAALAPAVTHPAVAAAVVASAQAAAHEAAAAAAPQQTLSSRQQRSARRAGERNDDDDDEFVPKSTGPRGTRSRGRSSRPSRYADSDSEDSLPGDVVAASIASANAAASAAAAKKKAPPTISAAERKLRAQLASTPDSERLCCVCSGPRPVAEPGDDVPEEPFDPTQFDYSEDSSDQDEAEGAPPRDTYLARLDRRTAMAQRLLLTCNTCYRSFHTACAQYTTDTALKVRDLVLRGGRWQCIECKLCDVCDEAGDENKLLICDLCERSYHMYCLRPPLRQLPDGGWRCTTCVRCVACGTTQPGVHGWARDYTLCSKCDAGLTKSSIARCACAFTDRAPKSRCQWFNVIAANSGCIAAARGSRPSSGASSRRRRAPSLLARRASAAL